MWNRVEISNTKPFCTDAVALDAYGGGSGPIHFTEFNCTGNESHLINCSLEYFEYSSGSEYSQTGSSSEYSGSSSEYSGSEDV